MTYLSFFKENPDLAGNVNLTIRGSDLLHFAQELLNSKKEPVPPAKETEVLFTADEAAEFLKVSRVTLWSWEKKGILTPLKIGNMVRYKKSDIMEAMERRAAR